MGTQTLDKQLISNTFGKLLQYVKPSETNNIERLNDFLGDKSSDMLDGNGDKVSLLTLNMLDKSIGDGISGLSFRSSNYSNNQRDIFMISTTKRVNDDPQKSGMVFWRPSGVTQPGTKMFLRNSGQLLLSGDFTNFIDTFQLTNYNLGVQGGVYIEESVDGSADLLTCNINNSDSSVGGGTMDSDGKAFRVTRNGLVILRSGSGGPFTVGGVFNQYKTNLLFQSGSTTRTLYINSEDGPTTSFFSDYKLKRNIKTFNENILEKFYKLNLKSFEWNDIKKDLDVKNSGLVLIDNDQKSIDAYESEKLRIMNSSNGEKIGLIAQEVEEIFPDVVKVGEDGYKKIDIERLLYYSIGCIKELTDRLNKLES
jgi:hypothetical protein